MSVAKHWTIRGEEIDILYQESLGKGGFGEVHKVKFSFNDPR